MYGNRSRMYTGDRKLHGWKINAIQVNATWKTSMEVGVRVEAENAVTGEVRHTSTAYLTMVAVDEKGKPMPVVPVALEDEDEQRRQREAEVRRRNRLAEREEILGGRDRE